MIGSRIASAQREKEAGHGVLAGAPSAPEPLGLDEVLETLKALRDLLELLATVDQADRAALYQALGLTITYRQLAKAKAAVGL